MNLATLILKNLLFNEEYVRKVIPFIKPEYFEDLNQKIVFEEILSFVQEYNQPATKEVLCIEVEKRKDINDTSFNEIIHLISSLEDVPTEFEWLITTTEKWCRDRAIYLALMGPDGLEKVAAASCENTHQLGEALLTLPGVAPLFNAPYFHEFAVKLPVPVEGVLSALREKRIIGGYDLASHYPELGHGLLVCATEIKTAEDLHAFVIALKAVLLN